MKQNWEWLRRRFWDFRHGHGIYLNYILSFINFITITYHLLISNVRALKPILPHWWLYALFFCLTYPPLAILIGYREYRRKQYPTEQKIAVKANPYLWITQPGRDQMLSLPSSILTFKWHLRKFKKEGYVTLEEEAAAQKYLRMMTDLVEGKSLKKYTQD